MIIPVLEKRQYTGTENVKKMKENEILMTSWCCYQLMSSSATDNKFVRLKILQKHYYKTSLVNINKPKRACKMR
jgi:hypothetical protein